MKKLTKNKKIILAALIIIVVIISVIVIVFLTRSEYRRCSIKDALAELDNYQFGEYDNLEFECGVNLFNNDSLYDITTIFEIKPLEGNETIEQAKKIAYKMKGVNDFSNVDIYEDIEHGSVNIYDYNNGYNCDFYVTNCFGYVDVNFYNSIRDVDNAIENPDKPIKHYNVLKNGMPNETFKTSDGNEAGIASVASNSEKFINENLLEFLSGKSNEKLILTDIYIMETNMNKRYCHLMYSYEYSGMLLNSYGYVSDETSVRTPCLSVDFSNENNVFSFANNLYEGNNIKDVNKLSGKVYPLSSAEQMISDKLAPLKKYTVTEVSLRNVSICDYGEKYHTYKPMWCFLLEDNGLDSGTRNVVVGFVDMKSGEVHVYDTGQSMSLEELESH